MKITLLSFLILALSIVYLSDAKAGKKEYISLMAYNVLYNSSEIKKSIDLIKKYDPDILCLREMTPKFVDAFKKSVGKRYPYRAFYSRKGTWGVGIASKYVIIKPQHFPLKPHRIPGLQSIVQVERNQLMVVCLHLFPPVGKHKKSDGFFETLKKNEQLRQNQARYLVNKYSAWKGPLVLMGDMNEGPNGKAIRLFEQEMIERSCSKAPIKKCGSTYPGATSWLPAVFEIDHILGRKVQFQLAKVIKDGGSDHYPVYSQIVFTK